MEISFIQADHEPSVSWVSVPRHYIAVIKLPAPMRAVLVGYRLNAVTRPEPENAAVNNIGHFTEDTFHKWRGPSEESAISSPLPAPFPQAHSAFFALLFHEFAGVILQFAHAFQRVGRERECRALETSRFALNP